MTPERLAADYPVSPLTVGVVVLLAAAAMTISPILSLPIALAALVLALRGWKLSRTGLLGVFLTLLLLSSARYSLPVPSPIAPTLDRVALLLLAVLWIAGLTDARREWPAAAGPIGRPLWAFLGIAVASLVVNIPSIAGPSDVALGGKRLVVLGGYLVAYSLVLALVHDRTDAETVVGILLVLGAVTAAAAIVERFVGTSPLRMAIEALPMQLESSPRWMTRFGETRVFGSALHPLELGGVMSLLIPLAIYRALTVRRVFSAGFYWATAAAMTAALLFTVSRSSLIAVLLAAFIIAALSKRRSAIIAAGVAAAVLGYVLFPQILDTLTRMLQPQWLIENERASFSGRLNDYPLVTQLFAQRPLLGMGYGMFTPEEYFYLDNQYLKFLLETGIAGLLAALWFVGRLLRSLYRAASCASEQLPLEAALLGSIAGFAFLCALFDTFAFPQVTTLFFVIVGLAVVLLSERRPNAQAGWDGGA